MRSSRPACGCGSFEACASCNPCSRAIRTIRAYELEYGSATVELHTDAVKPGDRVMLIDDLIATGGTMMAGKKLLERLGAQVLEGAAIVDLPELGGSKRLRDAGLPLFAVVAFEGH